LKIWFDILTPKQVMFFKPAVDLLRESDHEILCTSRDYREAVELASLKQLDIKIVGRHGGPGRYEKLRESANRIFQLADLVNQFEPDIAITFSSPEGARVAFGLGIRHIGFNDSPHAEAVAGLTLPLTNYLLCPWIIPYSAWIGFGIPRNRIIKYKALDPAVWLKRSTKYTLPYDLFDKFNLDVHKKNILIRLEESKASYIADKNLKDRIFMIDSLVNSLWQSTNLIILCRYEDQIFEISKRYEGKAHVVKSITDGTALISLCDLFIGAGGTMTAEASLLGKPTISIAPVHFYVEKYLVASGLAKKASDSRDLVRLTKKLISDNEYASRQKKRAQQILDSMEDPICKVLPFLKNNA